VERVVADQQLDPLAVDQVEYHLVVAREPMGGLPVSDRRLLEEAVDVRAVVDVADLLLEVAAQARCPLASEKIVSFRAANAGSKASSRICQGSTG
jgi:hypothetical protein